MSEDQLQLFGGGWTEKKLETVRAYLKAYNTVLKNQSFTKIYVDAFAGTGYRQARKDSYDLPSLFEELAEEPQEFLKGSVRLALEVAPPFDKYVFVETQRDKVVELEKLRHEFPDKAHKIHIHQQDANVFVQNFCSCMKNGDRAVLFLDPFATEVSWKTIQAIAETSKIDMWFLFPLMAVNRLIANDPERACQHRLDDVFGTTDWFERFYLRHTQEQIFGESLEVVKRHCDIGEIVKYFRERLQQVFCAVAQSNGVLCNTRQSPIFHLFFAAGNPNGAKRAIPIAEHLLRKL